MSRIVYRINPVGKCRTEWFVSKRGREDSLTQYWFYLINKAKELNLFYKQGFCKDRNLYFTIRYNSGEERIFKFVR